MNLSDWWTTLAGGVPGSPAEVTWAVFWVLLGAVITLLLSWPRMRQISRREREVNGGLARLEEWRETARRHFNELNQREKALRRAEDELKAKGAQIASQIEQIRAWMDRAGQSPPESSGKTQALN